jgi:sugar lactone lactonase YvrE
MTRKLFGSWCMLSVVSVSGVACSGSDGDSIGSAGDAAAEPDAAAEVDAGDACPSSDTLGALAITVDIPSGVDARVAILDADGDVVGETLTESATRSVPAGRYTVAAHRVREPGTLVGAAYQPAVTLGESVCVRGEADATASVRYTREPGSARLWLTQSNGTGASILAFDADQLNERGDQTPAVGLAHTQPSSGPLRVDALGRLWMGSSAGALIGFETDRLGESSSEGPDITLTGAALCEDALPCGPRALAFDARGALYVATLTRIVRLAPESLDASGEPTAAITITSPDVESPSALAFDADGNLWVGESSGAIVRFDASRLDADITNAAADVVIYAGTDTPVAGLFGSPEGLVFDADGNLWVGYFTGNDLVRLSPSDLAASHASSAALVPSTRITIGVEALVTDLALDEAGNLWLPGSGGTLYMVPKAQLSSAEPSLERLSSAEIGTVERLTFNTVPGATFIAP